jgi:hypothetical protein
VRLFENRVLRRICGKTRSEVIGVWRKLHNEELRHLFSSPNIIRVMNSRRMRTGHVALMAEKRKACNILAGKTEGKDLLGG